MRTPRLAGNVCKAMSGDGERLVCEASLRRMSIRSFIAMIITRACEYVNVCVLYNGVFQGFHLQQR